MICCIALLQCSVVLLCSSAVGSQSCGAVQPSVWAAPKEATLPGRGQPGAGVLMASVVLVWPGSMVVYTSGGSMVVYTSGGSMVVYTSGGSTV